MAKISKHNKAEKNYYITANTILNLAKRAREIFENSEPQKKRQLLNFLLQSLELKDKNLIYKLKAPFGKVLLASICSDLLRGLPIYRTLQYLSANQNQSGEARQTMLY